MGKAVKKKEPKEVKDDDSKDAKKREKKPAPAAARPARKVEAEREGFRGIVRIAGKDVSGQMPLKRSLLRIRGVSHGLSNAVSGVINSELSIAPDTRVGDLTDEQIEKIDKLLFSLQNYGIPKFMFNRRSDCDTGEDRHVIMNDLMFCATQDVERMKKLYTWKGYRHSYGQKVRGQRTRNTGRTGMAVGVLRKAILAQQKAASAPSGGGAGAPAASAPAKAAPAKKEEKK